MRIVFCSSEMVPFAKTGGLADVTGALPLVLERAGHNIVVILPFYKEVKNSGITVHKLNAGTSYAELGNKIRVYFIEEDAYFNRNGLYGDKSGDYKDNLEKFSYYSKRSPEYMRLFLARCFLCSKNGDSVSHK